MFLRGPEASARRYILSGPEYTDGAYIALDGKDIDETTSDNIKGQFKIGAHNGTMSSTLIGKPDGTLCWSGGAFAVNQ